MSDKLESLPSLENGASVMEPGEAVPLVVDLDGTLVKTDVLIESFFALLKRNSLYILAAIVWLIKGRAYLKRQISARVTLDVSLLPYNKKLLDYMKEERSRGRSIVLATASDERIAGQVADHLKVFDGVLASNGVVNLSGRRKRDRLAAQFGEKHFDYAGNSAHDVAVWSSARRAILVNPTRGLSRAAARVAEIECEFRDREPWMRTYMRALRLNQWLKNLLVFLPLAMEHRFFDPDLLTNTFLAFVAFGFCASSVYLMNDILDLPSDRRHPKKRLRPFAAGELSLFWGVASIPVLLGLSILSGLVLPWPFLGMLVIYFLLNLGYSFTIKRIVLLDVIILAGLYTMRILAGAASVAIWPSYWLLAFSTFLFLSLALVKRYAELVTMSGLSGNAVQVRGYQGVDRELLSSMGSASGYVAVLVLAIYISSGTAEIHYSRHYLIWLLCPLLLYWISHVWLTAHRGNMHDDPLVFTVHDWTSRIVFLVAVLIFLLAI